MQVDTFESPRMEENLAVPFGGCISHLENSDLGFSRYIIQQKALKQREQLGIANK